MVHPRRLLATAWGCLLACALAAQQAEPTTLAVEVRGSFPEAGLADASGGGSSPGVGVSLMLEQDLSENFEGWRARAALGMDYWFWGNFTKTPGSAGKVNAGHITGELVRMLRPTATSTTLGPYLVLGMGLYAWSWSRTDPVLGKIDTRTGHMVGLFGFGWRYSRTLDFELKALSGKLDPSTTAVAIIGSAALRF